MTVDGFAELFRITPALLHDQLEVVTMRIVNRRVLWHGVLSLTLFLLSIRTGFASDTYSNTAYGFSIRIPSGWNQIPEDLLQTLVQGTLKPGSPLSIVAGFKRADGDVGFSIPYVLVQVLPYSRVGVNHQPREEQLKTLIKRISGMDPRESMDRTIQDESRDLISQVEMQTPVYYESDHHWLVETRAQIEGAGAIRSRLSGWFGSQSMVQVVYCDLADQWDQYALDRDVFLASVQFDLNREYRSDEFSDLTWFLSADYSRSIVLLAMAIFLFAGAVAKAWRKKKKSATEFH